LTITFIFDIDYNGYISYLIYLPQNQDKMKTKLNIAPKGTYNGDVVGGLLSWTGEKPSGAFVLKYKTPARGTDRVYAL